jgi:hypothetical protein
MAEGGGGRGGVAAEDSVVVADGDMAAEAGVLFGVAWLWLRSGQGRCCHLSEYWEEWFWLGFPSLSIYLYPKDCGLNSE